MNILIIVAIVILLFGAFLIFAQRLLSSKDHPSYFISAIKKYEKIDLKASPNFGSILFTGSSVMKYWKTLEDDMAPFPVLNRALAGTKITEVTHFVDRIIIPYQPKAVVLYAGSNDIQGKSPRTSDQVFESFKLFVDKVHTDFSETKIFFISIAPSPVWIRWKHWPEVQKANLLIQDFCKRNSKLHFVDLTEQFLNDAGKPKRELFKIDGIHMNHKGYEIWTSSLKPLLK